MPVNALNYTKISWFPGHMYWGLWLIENRIKEIDIFIEVWDARVPLSSFNKDIDDIIWTHKKEKIVIFNKFDLCNKQKTNKVVEELKQLGF